MGFWKDAFTVEKATDFVANDREKELLQKFAAKVVRHGMTTPAILFLESFRPLNFIGSQGMAFFEPVVRGAFDWQAYSDFARMLERRGSVEALIAAIEKAESEHGAALREQRQIEKKLKKAHRRRLRFWRKKDDTQTKDENCNGH